MFSKVQLRREIEAARQTLDSHWLVVASSQVVENFRRLPAFHTAKTVALYKAIGGEVDLEPLFPACWKLDKRTCIPLFNAKTRRYEMAVVTAETHYLIGHYGIREPRVSSLLAIDQIDLIAVPGVAFDPQGNRLGRGGGYYDRLLDRFSGVAAAVGFDFQIRSKIPSEPHDKPMDLLVTETKVVDVYNER